MKHPKVAPPLCALHAPPHTHRRSLYVRGENEVFIVRCSGEQVVVDGDEEDDAWEEEVRWWRPPIRVSAGDGGLLLCMGSGEGSAPRRKLWRRTPEPYTVQKDHESMRAA